MSLSVGSYSVSKDGEGDAHLGQFLDEFVGICCLASLLNELELDIVRTICLWSTRQAICNILQNCSAKQDGFLEAVSAVRLSYVIGSGKSYLLNEPDVRPQPVKI